MNWMVDVVAPLSALGLTAAITYVCATFAYGGRDEAGLNRFERFVANMPAVNDVLRACWRSDADIDPIRNGGCKFCFRAQERVWLDIDGWQDIKDVHRHVAVGVRWAERAGFMEVRHNYGHWRRNDPFVRMTDKGSVALNRYKLREPIDTRSAVAA